MLSNIDGNVALQNVLATLETDRKKIAATQTKGYIYIALGILIAIIGIFIGFVGPAVLAGLIPIIIGGVIAYRIGDELHAYKDAFKRDVIGSALKSLDQTLTIEPYKGVKEYEFNASQIFNQTPDRYACEDLVSGRIDKTAFYFSEVHAEYKTTQQTKNGTQTTWHDLFKGIIFVADFNKNFNGITIVRQRDIGTAFGAWFSKNLFSFSNRDVVELENSLFNKKFVTYGTNQVEARYILTPAMMERILELNNRSKYTISLSFINSRMYIAFPLDRNYFEAPVFKTLLNPTLLDDDISTINFMYDIVQELDLNTRIWGKE